ncbi:MAG: tRNA (adenosine(37)-N6)-threonylcarbamoyltransferase complex ATPase subunit type 1 TsaE [bacterium]
MNAATVTEAELREALLGQKILHLRSDSAEETRGLATKLAGLLEQRQIVLLFGNLGSGKTTFVKGICAALGVPDKVTSPTFTIMHLYRGAEITIYHFDFYRLESWRDIAALGVEEYFDGDGICLIEWPERVLPLLPSAWSSRTATPVAMQQVVRVQLTLPEQLQQPDVRLIEISRRAA